MIGSKLYKHDYNKRVYRRDENGLPFGGPIYSESFHEHTITGETRVSWLSNLGGKIPKHDPRSAGYLTAEEKALDVVANDMRGEVETWWRGLDAIAKLSVFRAAKADVERIKGDE